MLNLANRVVRTFSDVTVGTALVLVHVLLAERLADRVGAPRVRSARPRRD